MDDPAATSSGDDRRRALAAIGLGVVVFGLAWIALRWLYHAGAWGPALTSDDVDLYRYYAFHFLRGELPYRDFRLDYPPVSLLAFALPAWLGGGTHLMATYRAAFETTMLAVGLVLTGTATFTAWRLGADRRRLVLTALVVGMTPLLIGPVILGRFDLLPAALTAGVVALVVADRPRLAVILLGLAILAKLYPAVLVPLVVVSVWRREGRRESIVAVALLALTCWLVMAPLLVDAPAETLRALTSLANRPLQVETLGAAALSVGQGLGWLRLDLHTIANSVTVGGPLADAAVAIQTTVLVAVLVGIYVAFTRSRADPPAFVRAAAAALVAFVAFGKILSPQYLIWLVPLVPLVGGRRGVLTAASLAVALVLTSLFFPGEYDAYVDGDALIAGVVLARDLVLVALLAVLVAPERWIERPARTIGALRDWWLERFARPVPGSA